MLSPGQMPSTNNHALVPHLSQMQARQQNELNAAEQAANNVSDDIELLQDHLHNISSLVGLDPSVDDLETYDVSDFLGQGHPVDGTEEDRQTLLALMRHHNPNSGADGTTADYFSNFGVLPASIPPTSSTPTDGTSMNIGSSMADMSQYAPSLTVPTMEVNAPGTGASSFRTGANSGLHVTDLATVVPSTTLPSGLPAVGTDDMQDPMFNLDDPFHNLALPENLDASDFDFLQDES
ncbi:hypothetical protein DFS34DRAFT_458417 [Phlyctochytrium arcticum]|nr:hypothetical protein DFS34DRAFT_458417 [Phlyctochytrium arcticum]